MDFLMTYSKLTVKERPEWDSHHGHLIQLLLSQNKFICDMGQFKIHHEALVKPTKDLIDTEL